MDNNYVEQKKKRERALKTSYRAFRLTPEQESLILAKAQAEGLTFSQYALKSMLDREYKTPPKKIKAYHYKELVYNLARIGANLNQIAKLANKNKVLDRATLAMIAIVNDKLVELRDRLW